jgi:REP element-mobilizing transposase RayT
MASVRGCLTECRAMSKRGILSADAAMATNYRAAMKEEAFKFDGETQLAILDAVLDSRAMQRFETYYIATESTHVHILVGWRDKRPWLHMRSIIKGSISRKLNQKFGKRNRLAEGGSRKKVKDRAHFDWLVNQYLAKHRGWKWSPERGKFR